VKTLPFSPGTFLTGYTGLIGFLWDAHPEYLVYPVKFNLNLFISVSAGWVITSEINNSTPWEEG
jgi:hypothetical protein